MPFFRLSDALVFPDPALAEDDGLLAVGGDLSRDRVLLAYRNGIFPWSSEGRPLLWWAPAPRFVLLPGELHVGRSLRRAMAQAPYELTLDRAFEEVMDHCARVPRVGQDGTWITRGLRETFVGLHREHLAHSVEAWHDGRLVGGLYGLALGSVFFGESMFALAPNASKIAFATLVAQLQIWGFDLIDCQVHTEHLERFGARMIELEEFRSRLRQGVDRGMGEGEERLRPQPWRFDGGLGSMPVS